MNEIANTQVAEVTAGQQRFELQHRSPNAAGTRLVWNYLRYSQTFSTEEEARQHGANLDQDGIFDEANLRVVPARRR